MTACQALQLFSPPGWSENWATIATGIARPASPSAKRVPRPLPGPAVPPAPFTFAAPAVVPCGTPCGSSPLLACGSVNGPRPITCGPEGAARNTPRPSGCSATFGCASSSLCAATAGLTMSPSFLRLNPLIRPWPYALDIGSLISPPGGRWEDDLFLWPKLGFAISPSWIAMSLLQTCVKIVPTHAGRGCSKTEIGEE